MCHKLALKKRSRHEIRPAVLLTAHELLASAADAYFLIRAHLQGQHDSIFIYNILKSLQYLEVIATK